MSPDRLNVEKIQTIYFSEILLFPKQKDTLSLRQKEGDYFGCDYNGWGQLAFCLKLEKAILCILILVRLFIMSWKTYKISFKLTVIEDSFAIHTMEYLMLLIFHDCLVMILNYFYYIRYKPPTFNLRLSVLLLPLFSFLVEMVFTVKNVFIFLMTKRN